MSGNRRDPLLAAPVSGEELSMNVGAPVFMRPKPVPKRTPPPQTETADEQALRTVTASNSADSELETDQGSHAEYSQKEEEFGEENLLRSLSLEQGRDASCLLVGNSEQDRLSLEAESALGQLLSLTGRFLTEMEVRNDSSPVILWFRQDLRLADNPALTAAVRSGRPVIPVYIHVNAEEGRWPLGGAAAYWLHHALLSLSNTLKQQLGSRLLLLSGESSLDQLLQVIMETGATALYFNRVYEPWKITRDTLIAEVLSENGVEVCSFKGVVLFEPLEVIPDRTERLMYGFGSVGFFLNACDGHDIEEPLPAPTKRLRTPAAWPSSLGVSDLKLAVLPLRPDGSEIDWAAGIRDFWGFDEAAALSALAEFVEHGCFHFEGRQRFRADRKYTALISPYIRFGQLSPRTVYAAVVHRHPETRNPKPNPEPRNSKPETRN